MLVHYYAHFYLSISNDKNEVAGITFIYISDWQHFVGVLVKSDFSTKKRTSIKYNIKTNQKATTKLNLF